MKKIIILSTLLSTFSFSWAQITIVDDNDLQEGKQLIESYLSPLGQALGTGLNNSWFTTAKPHKLLGFDLTLSVTPVLIPETSQSFNVDQEGSFKGGETPTLLGKGQGNEVSYQNSVGNFTFNMPDGLGTGGLLIPMIQAGVGLPKSTEINMRYFPKLKMDYISLDMMGVGIKHDLLQWIPVAEKLPVHVSIMAGHTRFNSTFDIQNQEIDLSLRATTYNLIFSKKIALLTALVGVGYNSSTTNFDINLGEEKSFYLGQGANLLGINTDDLTNFDFEKHQEFKAQLGLRVQLAILSISANYATTASGHKSITAGLGLSFR